MPIITGELLRKVHSALVKLFDEPEVERLVRFELPDVRYENLVGSSQPKPDAFFQLLDQLEKLALVLPFVEALAATRPRSTELAELAKKITEVASRSFDDSKVAASIEMDHGAVPLQSRFYISQAAEQTVFDAVEHRSTTVTLRGPRKCGKSSLLFRVQDWARHNDAITCRIDLREFTSETLTDAKQLFFGIADEIADSDDVDSSSNELEDNWSDRRGPMRSLTRFVEKCVLPGVSNRLFLIFDDADRAMNNPEVGTNLFRLLRVWHDSRVDDPAWDKLTTIVSHEIEPAELILDRNNSPFNVGLSLTLQGFTEDETAELNRLYGNPLSGYQAAELNRFAGGHPYLVRLALYQIANAAVDGPESWRQGAVKPDGAAYPVFRALARDLEENPELLKAFREVEKSNDCSSRKAFQALWRLGLIEGSDHECCSLRGELFADFVRENL